MENLVRLLAVVVALVSSPLVYGAQISGIVFEDYNNNGIQEPLESEFQSGTVKAYKSRTVVATASISNGGWVMNLPSGSYIFEANVGVSGCYRKYVTVGSIGINFVALPCVPLDGTW